MVLLIVIQIIVLVLSQFVYRNKYALKKNGRLLFLKYRTIHCTKTLLRENLLSIYLKSDGRERPEEKLKVQPMHIEPGLYPNFVDIVVALNDIVRKSIGAQKYENNGFNVSGDEITQKSAIHSPGDQSVFMIQSVDLSHIFGDELEQNWTGGVTKAKGPHHPQYS